MIKLKHTKSFKEEARKKGKVTYHTQPLQDYALDSGASEMNMKLVEECLYANVPKEMRYKSSKEITDKEK